jgi:hypothetical protein
MDVAGGIYSSDTPSLYWESEGGVEGVYMYTQRGFFFEAVEAGPWVPPFNTWVHMVLVHDPAAGGGYLYADGVLVMAAESPYMAQNFGVFGFGLAGGHGAVMTVSDVVVYDADVYDGTRLPDLPVGCFRTRGDGALHDWVAGNDEPHWPLVHRELETEVADSLYLLGGPADRRETFLMEQVNSGATVRAVQSMAWISSAADLDFVAYAGGTMATGQGFDPGSGSPRYIRTLHPVYPDGGGAWTPDLFRNTEFGVRNPNAITIPSSVGVHQLVVEVLGLLSTVDCITNAGYFDSFSTYTDLSMRYTPPYPGWEPTVLPGGRYGNQHLSIPGTSLVDVGHGAAYHDTSVSFVVKFQGVVTDGGADYVMLCHVTSAALPDPGIREFGYGISADGRLLLLEWNLVDEWWDTTALTPAGTFVAGTYYGLELYALEGNENVRVRLDGNLVFDGSAHFNGAAYYWQFFLGNPGDSALAGQNNPSDQALWLEDLVVGTDTLAFRTLYPWRTYWGTSVGPGVDTEWVPVGAATNWEAVAGVLGTAWDASYVRVTSATGERSDLYEFYDLPLDADNIASVNFVTQCFGSGHYTVQMLDDGVYSYSLYDRTGLSEGSVFQDVETIIETYGNQEWTVARFNDGQYGVYRSADNAAFGTIRVGEVWVEVLTACHEVVLVRQPRFPQLIGQ